MMPRRIAARLKSTRLRTLARCIQTCQTSRLPSRMPRKSSVIITNLKADGHGAAESLGAWPSAPTGAIEVDEFPTKAFLRDSYHF